VPASTSLVRRKSRNHGEISWGNLILLAEGGGKLVMGSPGKRGRKGIGKNPFSGVCKIPLEKNRDKGMFRREIKKWVIGGKKPGPGEQSGPIAGGENKRGT